jgi:PKD repeat protein
LDGTCNCTGGYTGDRCQTAPAAPVASFTIDKTSCTAPCTFNVSSTSTNATSIRWEVEKVGGSAFITINNSTSANATIEFGSSQTGTYKVKLTATNAGGSHTAEKTITVNSASNPCETQNTAEVTITITGSTNPYKVYIDGVYQDDIQTPGWKKFTVSAGNRSFKVEQRSGYVLTPTIRETSIFAEKCGTYDWEVNL